MEKKWHLAQIENDRPVTKATDSEFLLEYQQLVLLALEECSLLTRMQCRYADALMQKQWKNGGFLR